MFYPLILRLLPAVKRNAAAVPPTTLTVIIPAYNEAEILAEKINNTLQQTGCRLQVIVITDGSSDRSAEVAASIPGILALHEPERRGKAAALNRATTFAEHEILVFTDANTLLKENALRELAQAFADEHTGAVCGEKRVQPAKRQSGAETVYWQYESVLKKWESRTGSVVGAAGELLAVRKTLFEPLPEAAILDDFYLSIHIIQKGYRLAYAPKAVATEAPPPNLQADFTRRTRIAAGVMQWMCIYARFRKLSGKTFFCWQLFSHRICRWFVAPVSFLVLPVSLGWLAFHTDTSAYTYAFGFVVFCGLLVLLGTLPALRVKKTGFPFYFVFMHVCLLWGYIGYWRGRHSVLWKKPAR